MNIPKGKWWLCPDCKEIILAKEHATNLYVCIHCDHHARIGSDDYFDLLFDKQKYKKRFRSLRSKDPIHFKDLKTYEDRLEQAIEKTKLSSALQVAIGRMDGDYLVIAAMDFSFIGGSMGAVVGEKIARAIDYSIAHRYPLLIISKSGGARMMESAFSLMQMAKTAAKLSQLEKAKVPYISLLTDPTTGGVSASFAMLGDLNISEPRAMIGFAGPRIIRETMQRELPKDFQSAESLLEHGFLDLIVHRKDLKAKLSELLGYFPRK